MGFFISHFTHFVAYFIAHFRARVLLQRIAIARAVYSDADNILLDDPLSALDARVAQEVFTNAVTGEWADKCAFLSNFSNGRITEAESSQHMRIFT